MSFATALSITAHESPITIIDQCLNNVIVGQFDAIAIHINRNADFDMGTLARLIDATPPLRGVVHINPERLPTDWVAPGLLHRAHISNFRLLNAFCSFDVFCTDASNTLLVRGGLKAHLEQQQLGIDPTSAFGWRSAWEDNLRNDLLFEQIGEACRRNQIEGMFMSTDLFERTAVWIEAYDRALDERVASGQEAVKLPREEYLFGTGLSQLGVSLKETPYILMRQGSGLTFSVFGNAGQPVVNHVVGPGSSFSWYLPEIQRSLSAGFIWPLYWDLIADHIPPIPDVAAYQRGKFGIKRVNRPLEDPIRQAVRTHFDYGPQVLEAMQLL